MKSSLSTFPDLRDRLSNKDAEIKKFYRTVLRIRLKTGGGSVMTQGSAIKEVRCMIGSREEKLPGRSGVSA